MRISVGRVAQKQSLGEEEKAAGVAAARYETFIRDGIFHKEGAPDLSLFVVIGRFVSNFANFCRSWSVSLISDHGEGFIPTDHGGLLFRVLSSIGVRRLMCGTGD